MSFNILKFLLPAEEKIFYSLFESSIEVARKSAIQLHEMLTTGINNEQIAQIKALKKRSNEIHKQTLKTLSTTFITPMEPEDIQNISTLLNKISKRIAKVASNIKVYKLKKPTDAMIKQSKALMQATKELDFVVHQFQKSTLADKIASSNMRIKEIENKGDDILDDAMKELFGGKFDALEVIKLGGIYKDLEATLDICFAVSDQIINIVLKQS